MANPTIAKIHIQPGKVAPRHSEYKDLECVEIVVTEQGTAQGLPLVDFVCKDEDGHTHLLMLTGRIVNGISAVVKGVNQRIHGTPEP